MRTQRASSPQRLALVAQLVSLGSVGDKRWISSPEPRPVVPTPLCSHRGRGGVGRPTDAAVLLIRAVTTVVKHVTAQGGRQAALVPAKELLLVFAVGILGRGGLWGGRRLQALGTDCTTPPPTETWLTKMCPGCS